MVEHLEAIGGGIIVLLFIIACVGVWYWISSDIDTHRDSRIAWAEENDCRIAKSYFGMVVKLRCADRSEHLQFNY